MSINYLIFLISVVFCSNSDSIPKAKSELGYKIGHIENGKNIISIDSTKFKQQWEKILPLPNVKLDKIEICEGLTLGEKAEVFYMLIAYDKNENLKTARWLIREGDTFYFYKSPQNENNPDHSFFRTYFSCYGTPDDCVPRVFFIDNHYRWSCSDKFYCDPDSPCKSSTLFFPNE